MQARSRPVPFVLRDEFPSLAAELTACLETMEEPALAAQVDTLRVVARCRCGDDFCATMYTAPPPRGAYGRGHRNVALNPEAGDLILDVVDERIVAVEILYRDAVRQRLLELLP